MTQQLNWPTLDFTRYEHDYEFMELFDSESCDEEEYSEDGKVWRGYTNENGERELVGEYVYDEHNESENTAGVGRYM